MSKRAGAVLLFAAALAARLDAQPTTPTEAPGGGIIPTLNLYLPEGQADIRLSRLVKNSLFESQFEYDFVSGDIGAYLRYKYYGSRQTLTLSGFDNIAFRSLETVSNDFDRTRGFNVLLRRPLNYQRRLLFLGEYDKLTFSDANPDNNRSNLFLKMGYQVGTSEDNRSNQISGDRNDRIRSLFTAFRDIGLNGYGLSLALTWGVPVGSFSYVRAEGEALKIVDLPRNRRLIGRVHGGFFPYKKDGPPEMSSANLPYRIPGSELFRIDGRDALRGDRSGGRGTNEVHVTLELFQPVFINKNANFLKLTWNTLYLVGYLGTGNIGTDSKVYTRLGDWRQDAGVGAEVSFSYQKYQVFVSALAARVFDQSGSPRFLLTVRSAN